MFFFAKDSVVNFKAISIESAYLAILNDDLDTAFSIFKSIDSPRAKWGVVLVDIVKGFIEHYPTYFDIRNFLEIDLDFFIKNENVFIISVWYIIPDFFHFVKRFAYENVFKND